MGDEAVLITGGRGFLGRNLVNKLLEQSGYTIRILDLAPAIQLSDDEQHAPIASALQRGRVTYVSNNLRERGTLVQALQGVSVVFHMASPSQSITDYSIQYAVNVEGTRLLLEACQEVGVPKFIYTSTASVVFNGQVNIKNGDESLPYPPEHTLDSYNKAKAKAEELVLKANGIKGVRTLALRPSGIFGPGDTLFLPVMAKNAAGGKLKYIIGDGENMMDFTYVDNVNHAHICAMEALNRSPTSASEDPAGKVYFITNGEPRKFWDFLYSLAVPLGYSGPSGKLPAKPILYLAYVVEFLHKPLGALGVPAPDFQPYRIKLATMWRVFSSARAAKLLGYAPSVPLQEGIRRTVAAYPHLRKEALAQKAQDRRGGGASKTHRALGSGRVADTLLWRDTKFSILALGMLLLGSYVLFASGLTIVSLIADLGIIATLLLFTYHHAQPIVNKYTQLDLPDVSQQKWELSEQKSREVAGKFKDRWNTHVHPHIQRLSKERDAIFFIEVISGLIVLKWALGYFHTGTLIVTAIIAAFFVPALYERYEGETDELIEHAKQRSQMAKAQLAQTVGDIHRQVPKGPGARPVQLSS